jgi:hypothetical protein
MTIYYLLACLILKAEIPFLRPKKVLDVTDNNDSSVFVHLHNMFIKIRSI